VRLVARLRAPAGYTLVELLTVMVILGFVLAGVTKVFVQGSAVELRLNHRFQAQQQAAAAFDRLRRDIHCASSASATGGGNTLSLAGCGSGSVTWCAVTSATFSPFALYRKTGTTCDATGHFYAGNLVLSSSSLVRGVLFSVPTPPTGSRPKVTADVKVTPPGAQSSDAFELVDDIVLRNGARA
jgi:prepilin-type N-terminal cleavage/methylation domain-containing protein